VVEFGIAESPGGALTIGTFVINNYWLIIFLLTGLDILEISFES
jgi:hypothetical protein